MAELNDHLTFLVQHIQRQRVPGGGHGACGQIAERHGHGVTADSHAVGEKPGVGGAVCEVVAHHADRRIARPGNRPATPVGIAADSGRHSDPCHSSNNELTI